MDTTQVLLSLGAPMHLTGFYYVRDAVDMYFNRSDIGFVKGTYPVIAKIHGTKPENVERAIRFLISYVFTYGNLDECRKIFGNSIRSDKGHPSNKQFVATLAYYVQTENRKGDNNGRGA